MHRGHRPMSFDEVDDRWTDNGPECRGCGVRIKSGWECRTCASGRTFREVPEQDAKASLGGFYGFKYPPLPPAKPCDAETERESDDMPIIAKETGSTFTPAPAGAGLAVCCDVVDLGVLKTSFPGQPDKLQHKIRIVWQLADVDEAIGKRPIVSQRYTLSLHEKAALRRDLESWRGRQFTASELAGFDVEKVIGVPCMLNVVHRESKGKTYANVSAIMPVPKGAQRPTVEGYIRDKDRPKETAPAGDNGHQPTSDHDDSFAPDADAFLSAFDNEEAPF